MTQMKYKTYNLFNVLLCLSGFLFSGYMSSVKLFTSNCVFNEPCPLFLGYPACYFGFGLFSVLFITSILAFARKISIRASRGTLGSVALAGTLFAGNLVIQELTRYRAAEFLNGTLVLPTCAYGLVFFLLVCALSLYTPVDRKGPTGNPLPGTPSQGSTQHA